MAPPGSRACTAAPAGPRTASLRGRAAERWVAERLEGDGWEILARNWRGGDGELDLVVVRAGVMRFVEVKARGEDGLDPFEAIGAAKRRRLRSAAEAWLDAHEPPSREAAFLVALVGLQRGDAAPDGYTVEWLDDAF